MMNIFSSTQLYRAEGGVVTVKGGGGGGANVTQKCKYVLSSFKLNYINDAPEINLHPLKRQRARPHKK